MTSNIVRFSKWRDEPCDIWAIVDDTDMLPLIVKSCPYSWEERLNRPSQWWLFDKSKPSDSWRRVSVNKLPDEVCVELAKRVLLGETNND